MELAMMTLLYVDDTVVDDTIVDDPACTETPQHVRAAG
jgi:hypothetical protein